jgi:hypothetical protein
LRRGGLWQTSKERKMEKEYIGIIAIIIYLVALAVFMIKPKKQHPFRPAGIEPDEPWPLPVETNNQKRKET